MGMVYRQKGRTIWMLKYYREGRPIVESSGTDNKTKAKNLLRDLETDIGRGLPISSTVGKIRFEEAARDIEADYVTKGRRSLSDLKGRLKNHLEPAFGGRRLATITTADIRSYVVARLAPVQCEDGTETAGAAPATIDNELAALKRMYTLAFQGGKLLHRPHIPMLKDGKVRTGFFEPEQYAAVYARLPEDLQPVIQFAYLTGWRIRSEILPLEWRQVDFAGGTVRLDRGTTKNDDGRVFPFDVLPDLLALLKLQQRRRVELAPFVFPRDGQRIPVKAYYKAWHAACEGAGWPTLIPHDFRRTAVRNLVRAGVPEKTAMLLTGHKTRAVFDRYDIVNEADLREAVSRLAAAPAKKSAARGRVMRMAKAPIAASARSGRKIVR